MRPGRDSNPRVGVLQTPALPLGYQAVLGAGVEPARLAAIDLKSIASASSATSAWRRKRDSNPRIAVLQTAALPLRHCAIPPILLLLKQLFNARFGI